GVYVAGHMIWSFPLLARRLGEGWGSRAVLAVYHVVVGFFTMAPLYRDLGGEDLTTREALDRQRRLVNRLVEALLPSASGRRG
ncbi:MAG: hypothetical protein R3190_13740, partial [Thermoanaerobaculia bacterium]|nr:hypothetical protein [Thermoanaerobaculia bacterium]